MGGPLGMNLREANEINKYEKTIIEK